MRPSPGDLISGKYRLVRLIGDGGMGTVYEARHEMLGTAVALKFLHAELAKRTGLAQRFLQEARVSANIQSAHVTRVTDVDQAPDGTPYLVMELLNGESLQQLLDRRAKLRPDQAIDFALQTLAGLEAAHAIGVVHRDLKPDNVFVTPSSGGPLLKLIDFGIAKLRASNEYQRGLTRAGAMMGTPEYMAPEQLYSAADVDHRADLFSLGVMLFEMLSGTRPADGDDAQTIIGKVVAGDIRNLRELEPELPSALIDVVLRAIAPERQARYESAHDMRQALAPFAGELSHAGRLAATPVPAMSPVPLSSLNQPSNGFDRPQTRPAVSQGTSDDLQQRRSNVPATLPPDDGPPAPGKGSTQDASPLDIGRGSTEQAPPIVLSPAVSSGPWPPHGPTPAPRRRSRTLAAVLAVLGGAAVTGAIVAGLVVYRQNQVDDGPPSTLP
ncbi:MAG TPA: serine/threonine-protein kinase, partial [Polyangiaceae bacterium]|nr:serine/threonine-protein kinase [Polyangiaceae bacterium]